MRRIGTVVLLALAVLAALAGCSGCTVPETYIKADRQLYEFLAPEYLRYVRADEALSPEQIQDRVDLIDAWEFRIRQAGVR